MGAADDNRIVELRKHPPGLIVDVNREQGFRTFEITRRTAENLEIVLSQEPFGAPLEGEYSYWIRTLQCTEGRDWLFYRGKRSDFKIGIRIKLGTSRSLEMLPCSEQEYDSLSFLFPPV